MNEIHVVGSLAFMVFAGFGFILVSSAFHRIFDSLDKRLAAFVSKGVTDV